MKERREKIANELENFYELVKQLNDHKAMLTTKVSEKTSELETMEKSLSDVTKNVEKLKRAVQSQEISKEDVRKMNSERNHTKNRISRASEQKESNMKALWKSESEFKIQMENLTVTVSTYNAVTEELTNRLPQNHFGPENEKFKAIHLKHEVFENKFHSIEQNDFFGGIDIKGIVCPTLLDTNKKISSLTVSSRENLLDLLDKQDEGENDASKLKESIKVSLIYDCLYSHSIVLLLTQYLFLIVRQI